MSFYLLTTHLCHFRRSTACAALRAIEKTIDVHRERHHQHVALTYDGRHTSLPSEVHLTVHHYWTE